MARKPPAEVGLGQLQMALEQLPVAAARWIRAAHRKAFAEWQSRDVFPGLTHRFDQRPWSDLRSAARGKAAPIKRMPGPYGFAPRRRQIGVRGVKQSAVGNHKAANVTPAYVYTGAMKRELLKRRPKPGPRSSDGSVSTRFSLWHRSLALFGKQHGIERIERVEQPITYMMKSYRNAVERTGEFMMQVTRTIVVPRTIPASTTYLQDWAWKADEKDWIRQRSDAILAATVRSAAYDKSGKLRARYQKSEGV